MGWMSRQKTEWQGPEGPISATMAAWRPRTSSVLQRSILGPVLSSRWQITTKLTSNLGGVADMSEGLASIHWDLYSFTINGQTGIQEVQKVLP